MQDIVVSIKEFWQNGTLEIIGLRIIYFLIALVIGYIAFLISRKLLLNWVHKFVEKSKTKWDDFLLERKFFRRLCYIVPALIMYSAAGIIGEGYELVIRIIKVVSEAYMIVAGVLVVFAFFNALEDIYNTFKFAQKLPIRVFLQVIKIITVVFAGIFILSILINQPPFFFLGSLGAMTAVLLLVFKDSLLGLVAGIQLSANNMLKVGDWIEMPSCNADGDVIDISLTTVKVQNWDKTISTIPAYKLVSDSFKNWKGMSESGGRRIKRAINIDMNSIRFCDEELLNKFKEFNLISDYIATKRAEVAEFNEKEHINDSTFVNGRRLTNIGTFRAYIQAYLKSNPKIHKEMTFLVRQLTPSQYGIPIEIYVFSNDQVWANYEALQADIFDHLLAVIPEFDLKVFQNPTGSDFCKLIRN